MLSRPVNGVRFRAIGDGDARTHLVDDPTQRDSHQHHEIVSFAPRLARRDTDSRGGVGRPGRGRSPGRAAADQLLGWMRRRFMMASTAAGARLFIACAVTAIRGAIRIGRVRTAVTIQSAASSAVRPGLPS